MQDPKADLVGLDEDSFSASPTKRSHGLLVGSGTLIHGRPLAQPLERRSSYGSVALPANKSLVPTSPVSASGGSFDLPNPKRAKNESFSSDGGDSLEQGKEKDKDRDGDDIVDLDYSETSSEEGPPLDELQLRLKTHLIHDEDPTFCCCKMPRWMRCLWWPRGSWSFVIITHFGPSLYEQARHELHLRAFSKPLFLLPKDQPEGEPKELLEYLPASLGFSPPQVSRCRAVVPLCAYLLLFQWLVLNDTIDDIGVISGGIVAVIFGLFFFIVGLEYGLMPIGEDIGVSISSKLPRWIVLILAFVLGVGCTLAEPAIGALQTIGQIVKRDSAPYLYLVLNEYQYGLVAAVGAGVGGAVVLGSLRVVYGWRLRYIILGSLIPILGLSAGLTFIPDLLPIVGLAWDCGAATTGPVTVPVVLALGTGMGTANGQTSPFAGFGIATLASLWPVMTVQIFGVIVWWTYPKDAIKVIPAASQLWYEKSGVFEVLMTLRAILPLLTFLLVIQLFILKYYSFPYDPY